jgi:hypothetical protein
MLRRLGCLLVVLVAAAGTGCRRGDGEALPLIISEEAELEMTVKVGGDLSFEFDEKVKGKYTSIRSNGSGTVEILGVRPSDALRLDKAAFVPGMSLTPYHGDGSYVVAKVADDKPTDTTAPAAPGGPKSNVSLVWYSDGNLEGEPLQFERHLESCVVKIDDGGRTGHAKCPKMTSAIGGKTISLDFKWKAPKFKAHNRVTVPPDPATSSSTAPAAP